MKNLNGKREFSPKQKQSKFIETQMNSQKSIFN